MEDFLKSIMYKIQDIDHAKNMLGYDMYLVRLVNDAVVYMAYTENNIIFKFAIKDMTSNTVLCIHDNITETKAIQLIKDFI